jgi:hypothetical protein
MIFVRYSGQTGNQLFQYAFARLLAEAMEVDLNAGEIKEFPQLDLGSVWWNPTRPRRPIIIADLPQFLWNTPIEGMQFPIGYPTTLTGESELIGLSDRLEPSRDIFICAFAQQSRFYEPNRDRIMRWFGPSASSGLHTAVHVRGKDYIRNGVPPLDPSYYENALDIVGRKDAFVVTDDPDCEIVKCLGLPVMPTTPKSAFDFMRSAKKVVTSVSTFSWWAAFLSDASQIVQPEPSTGMWSKETPLNYLVMPGWVKVPVREIEPKHA